MKGDIQQFVKSVILLLFCRNSESSADKRLITHMFSHPKVCKLYNPISIHKKICPFNIPVEVSYHWIYQTKSSSLLELDNIGKFNTMYQIKHGKYAELSLNDSKFTNEKSWKTPLLNSTLYKNTERLPKKKFTYVLFSCYVNKPIHREYAEWSCVQQIPLLLHNDHEWIY